MFQSPEQKLNPFPMYAHMRREQPVAYIEAARAWCVFRLARRISSAALATSQSSACRVAGISKRVRHIRQTRFL